MKYAITDFKSYQSAWHDIAARQVTGKPFTVEVSDGIQAKRTTKQNSGIHVFCRELATALNNGGLDQRKMLKPGIDIPWDEKAVKERLWKPIQQAMLDTNSTTELNRKQVSEVYDVLNRHLSDKFGVSVPFPQRDAA